MFGDGHLASCKPISEADLASFMADCIEDKQKINQVLPIGGECTFVLVTALLLCSVLDVRQYVLASSRDAKPAAVSVCCE